MEIIKESVLQFEYKIMTYYGLMEIAVTHDLLKKDLTSSEDVLNELGKDGWELLTILREEVNSLFIFKRPKWVEKQSEQKLSDIDNKFIRMRETKPKDISEFLDRLTTVEQEFLWEHIAKIRDLDKEEQKSHSEILEKQGEPADKVEQKFHEGDWLCENEPNNYARFIQILEIVNVQGKNRYRISRDIHNDEDIVECRFVEDNWHSFYIQDIKDGDILVNGSNIFIFHYINSTRLMGYCHVNTDDERFYDDIGKNECFCLIDAIVNPATKEQRNLLFQKMKEAGYEWDAESKELKKIEQKPADVRPKFKVGYFIKHNKANIICKVISVNNSSYYVENIETSGRIELFRAEQSFHLWSIEDAKDGDILAAYKCYVIFKEIDGLNIKSHCTYRHYEGFSPSFLINTLQNKTAFQPATKEQREVLMKAMADAGYVFDFKNKELKKIESSTAWSEEDEAYKEFAISAVEDYYDENNPLRKDILDWLKSLKPQKQWKPSEEQVKAFEHFVRSIGESGYASPYENNTKLLYSLLGQLKKL